MALLRPGRCGSRRQGGCLQHRTEAQRRPKGQHAGGTPALPGNHSPLEGESQKLSRQAKADAVGGVWRATSQKADLRPLGNSRLPASRAPALAGGSFESETGFVSDKWSVPGAGKLLKTWLHYLKDCAEINKMLNASIKSLATIHYSLSRAPAPHDGADHPRVKQVWFQASVVGEGAVRSGIKLELFGPSRERWKTAAGAAVQRPVGKTPVSGDQRNQHPAAFIRMD